MPRLLNGRAWWDDELPPPLSGDPLRDESLPDEPLLVVVDPPDSGFDAPLLPWPELLSMVELAPRVELLSRAELQVLLSRAELLLARISVD